MATMFFEESADAAMTALEADPSRSRLLERVNAALAALEANHGDARCRRRSYGVALPGAWGMPVRSRDHDWLILWKAGPGDDEVTVFYVGPDL